MDILVIEEQHHGGTISGSMRKLLKGDLFTIDSKDEISSLSGANVPDIIIVDLDRDDKKSQEILKEMSKRYPTIPLLSLTTDTERARSQPTLCGTETYLITEDITTSRLLHIFRTFLERHHLTLEREKICNQIINQIETYEKKVISLQQRLTRAYREKRTKSKKLNETDRLLRLINECNEIRNTSKNESEYLKNICDILIVTAGYSLVWIGALDQETQTLVPWVYSGLPPEEFENATIIREDTDTHGGPGSRALKKMSPVIIKMRDGESGPYASALGIPILKDEQAVVVIYSPHTSFVSAERKILYQLAEDMTSAIRSFRIRDLSKKTEEAFRDTDMFFKTMSNTLPVGILVVGEDNKIGHLSKKSREMLRLPELVNGLGSPFDDLLSSQEGGDKSGDASSFVRGVTGEKTAECVIVRFDGTKFWSELRTAPLRDENEEIIGTLIVMQDITERKDAETTLRAMYAELERKVQERTADLVSVNIKLTEEVKRREQLMTALKESERALKNKQILLDTAERLAHIGSWEWDFKTDSERWSDESYRLYGFHPQSVTPTNHLFRSLVHPEDRTKLNEEIFMLFSGESEYRSTFRIIGADGEIRCLHAIGEMIRDDTGQAIGIRGTTRDITHMKGDCSCSLHTAKINWASDEAIIGMNAKTEITIWSGGAEDFFGYSHNEMIGKQVMPLLFPMQIAKIQTEIESAITRDQRICCEAQSVKRDNTTLSATLILTPVRGRETCILMSVRESLSLHKGER